MCNQYRLSVLLACATLASLFVVIIVTNTATGAVENVESFLTFDGLVFILFLSIVQFIPFGIISYLSKRHGGFFLRCETSVWLVGLIFNTIVNSLIGLQMKINAFASVGFFMLMPFTAIVIGLAYFVMWVLYQPDKPPLMREESKCDAPPVEAQRPAPPPDQK